jgi:hypothetical protein
MGKNLKKLKKARSILDDAIVGYTEGNIAVELDETYKIINEVITEEDANNGD